MLGRARFIVSIDVAKTEFSGSVLILFPLGRFMRLGSPAPALLLRRRRNNSARTTTPPGRASAASTDSQGTVTNTDSRGKVISREFTSGNTTTIYDAGGRNFGRATTSPCAL